MWRSYYELVDLAPAREGSRPCREYSPGTLWTALGRHGQPPHFAEGRCSDVKATLLINGEKSQGLNSGSLAPEPWLVTTNHTAMVRESVVLELLGDRGQTHTVLLPDPMFLDC